MKALNSYPIVQSMTADQVLNFWKRVDIQSTGCWAWTGKSVIKGGYSRFSFWNGGKSRSLLGHRVSYQLTIGPIPEGLTLDHTCKNPICVAPDHLEPVTQKVNNLRGNNQAALNSRKTHCVNGHPFDVPRIEGGKVTGRRCKICRDAANLRHKNKRLGTSGRTDEQGHLIDEES